MEFQMVHEEELPMVLVPEVGTFLTDYYADLLSDDFFVPLDELEGS